MRRRVALVVLWWGLVAMGASWLPAYAQQREARTFFEQGNAQYEAGDYSEAVRQYQRALASGYASGALYHNMGNAYFRLDSLGQAIRYYEKAHRLLPADRHLRHNLAIARSRTVDDFPRPPTPVWEQWWYRVLPHIGAWGLFLAGLISFSLGLGLAARRIWTGTQTPWARRGMAAALLLGGMLLAAAFGASLDAQLNQRVVVIAEETPLREAATAEASPALTVHEGTVLDVLSAQDAWLRVQLPNGRTGWVAAPATAAI